MRYCQKCQEWLGGDPATCPKCGSPTTSDPQSQKTEDSAASRKTSNLDWSILIAITLSALLIITPWIFMWLVFAPAIVICVIAIYRGNKKSGIALLVFCVIVYGLSRHFSPLKNLTSSLRGKSNISSPSETFRAPPNNKSNMLTESLNTSSKGESKKHDVNLIDWIELEQFEKDSGEVLRSKNGKWLLVLFEVKNNGAEPLKDWGWKKQLSDTEKRRYDSDSAFEVTYLIKRNLEKTYPDIEPDNLNPGCTGKYLVLFDIPKRVIPAKFIFIPNMFNDFELQFPLDSKRNE